MRSATLLFLLIGLIQLVVCERYAVLVAGSSGYQNYRHQSDVAHSYQLLLKDGVPADNIIVMTSNDVPFAKENPFPGTLFNKPTYNKEGVNVYEGLVVDYSGNDVTPQNFINVLLGNQGSMEGIGSGRVLNSTHQDHVFIYYSDHGGAGLIAFPAGGYLFSDQLVKTLQTMHRNFQFNQLTFYLEACESGSMFLSLPANIKVYSLSASNPTQSSWATYCYPDDQVNGVNLNTCLGDEFSVNWIENTQERSNLKTESLEDQFILVRNETEGSEAMQWGDLIFVNSSIDNFFGTGSIAEGFLTEENPHKLKGVTKISARETKIIYLMNAYQRNPTEENRMLFQIEMKHRMEMEKIFAQIKQDFHLNGRTEESTNFDCYRLLIGEFESNCGEFGESNMQFMKYLYEMCRTQIDFTIVGKYFAGLCQSS